MSDLILRLRIELEIDPSSVFELGSRGKPEPPDLDPELPEISGYSGISPRILRIFNIPGTTPGIAPETPDLGVRILRIFTRIVRT